MAANSLQQTYLASALPQDMPNEWQKAVTAAMGMPPYNPRYEDGCGHGHSHGSGHGHSHGVRCVRPRRFWRERDRTKERKRAAAGEIVTPFCDNAHKCNGPRRRIVCSADISMMLRRITRRERESAMKRVKREGEREQEEREEENDASKAVALSRSRCDNVYPQCHL